MARGAENQLRLKPQHPEAPVHLRTGWRGLSAVGLCDVGVPLPGAARLMHSLS